MEGIIFLWPIEPFHVSHNTISLPPKFCINYCLQFLLGACMFPREILKNDSLCKGRATSHLTGDVEVINLAHQIEQRNYL